MPHCVSRGEEGLKVHTAKCYRVLVGERTGNTEKCYKKNAEDVLCCTNKPKEALKSAANESSLC